MHRPHTTRSWQFVGLDLEDDQIKSHQLHMQDSEDLLTTANYGQDVIIGLLDTGFWPESKSFNDEGMEPIPKSWKGICQEGDSFNSSHCNKSVSTTILFYFLAG
uniref:2-alkenal reductase (NAD(P)(+)) n=1 Tax=Opuntia streptacantha TaxID=393608 RepID=A0A7C8ZJ45_OPUST